MSTGGRQRVLIGKPLGSNGLANRAMLPHSLPSKFGGVPGIRNLNPIKDVGKSFQDSLSATLAALQKYMAKVTGFEPVVFSVTGKRFRL